MERRELFKRSSSAAARRRCSPPTPSPQSSLRWSVSGRRRSRANVEVTLEANPGTVDLDKLRGFSAAGVNRMSFGVQSFHAHHLQRLGRIHDADACDGRDPSGA